MIIFIMKSLTILIIDLLKSTTLVPDMHSYVQLLGVTMSNNLHVTSTSFVGMIKQAQDCLTIVNLSHQYQDSCIEHDQIQQGMRECEVE